jgi:hypothetical protein
MTLKGYKNLIAGVAIVAGSPCWRPGVGRPFEGSASDPLATSNLLKQTPQEANQMGGSIERPFGDYLYKRQ